MLRLQRIIASMDLVAIIARCKSPRASVVGFFGDVPKGRNKLLTHTQISFSDIEVRAHRGYSPATIISWWGKSPRFTSYEGL